MADEFSEFLENPSDQTFRNLRDLVIQSPDYDFHSNAIEDVHILVDIEEYERARDELMGLMPGWLLSPRAHELIALVSEELNDEEGAQRERYMAQACYRGLLQSGSGSERSPYLVTHVADEYDLLGMLKKEFESQRQAVTENGLFDVITCTDGTELWFDLSPGLGDQAA